MAASLTAGAVFGSALTASGVYSPSIIISQMQLSNFHMLQVFLAASGTATIAIFLARRAKLTLSLPCPPSPLGLFQYDGNVIGGLVLGAGMTLTGACPGTVLVQVATGLRSGYFALLGGLVGGTLYAFLESSIRPARPAPKRKDDVPTLTLYEKLGVPEGRVFVVYEAMLLITVAVAGMLSPRADGVLLKPVMGGLAIGGAQVVSWALTPDTVGVSSGYEQIGSIARWLVGAGAFPATESITFVIGVFSGSFVLSRLVGLADIPGGGASIRDLTAITGGVAMVLGARIARGCTSGHGISGMSTFSLASIVSVASMFAGGIALALIL
ncbi:hypothetical protein LZ554_003328 [Drepanopeziza brunnea f. sp. 'monogermtubi']|nr:hypothetical protein LZ554_003328 [Drepanopeziza brunnea f. sp. 'monogermtubi']